MDRFEAKLHPHIVNDKNEFIRAAATRYAEHHQPDFFDLVDKHQQQLFETLSAHYRKVIPAFGALTLTQVKSRQFKSTEEDSIFTTLTNDWIHTEGLKRSKLIADTTEADVLAAISAGMDAGDGAAAIARSIMSVTDLSDWRSELIARTETHAAANYANAETARQAEKKLGIALEKAWSPTIDDRTRPDHAAMDPNNYIPLDEMFIVGGNQADRPGDPSLPADEVIACRCIQLQRETEQ